MGQTTNQDDASVSSKNALTSSPLGIKNFRLLLTTTVLTDASLWMQQITLSWLVYQLTGSGIMLGSVNLLRALASMCVIPVSGLLIDRYDRRYLMIAVAGWMVVIHLALGAFLLSGYSSLGLLFVFSFLSGVAHTIYLSMREVAVFDLVPRSLTPSAVAFIRTGWSLMRSCGPGLGGYLIVWIGAGGNFLVLAGFFTTIIGVTLSITYPRNDLRGAKGSAWQSLREGLSFVVRKSVTRTFMLTGFTLPIFIIPTFYLMPAIYTEDVFHRGADVMGLLMASVGVGGILGGFVTASLTGIDRRGRVLTGALAMTGICLSLFAFCEKIWMAMVLLALAGFFEMVFMATNQVLIQLSIPDHLRGRVTALVNLNILLSPMGAMLAGVMHDVLGNPRIVTVIMSITAVGIAGFVYVASPMVRDYRLGDAIAEEPLADND